MDYIRPRCCVCGKLTEPIKREKYIKNKLYFCGTKNVVSDCMKQYWQHLNEWYKYNKMAVTYRDVLLLNFPNADVNNLCTKDIFGADADNPNCDDISCEKCWNRKYKEE